MKTQSPQQVSRLISDEILTIVKKRLATLEQIKKQYQASKQNISKKKIEYENQLKKQNLNVDFIRKAILNWRLLQLRINQDYDPMKQLIFTITKHKQIIQKYKNIDKGIEYIHIESFKQLNNIYFQIQFLNEKTDIIQKNERFLKTLKADIQQYSQITGMTQLKKQIEQMKKEEEELQMEFLKQVENFIENNLPESDILSSTGLS